MRKKKNPLFYLILVTQLGLSMVLPIILALYIGNAIDDYIGTSPFVSSLLLVLGIISAFNNLLRLLKKDTKKDGKE